eukprot:6192474-Pleurochrysis_carterae.AAC.3
MTTILAYFRYPQKTFNAKLLAYIFGTPTFGCATQSQRDSEKSKVREGRKYKLGLRGTRPTQTCKTQVHISSHSPRTIASAREQYARSLLRALSARAQMRAHTPLCL